MRTEVLKTKKKKLPGEPKIEGLYKEELTRISKNAGIGGIGILIGAFITYLATIFATRVVGAENWGLFFLAQTVLLTLTVVSTLGLNQGVLRFVSLFAGKKDPARVKGTISFAMKRTLVVSSLLAIVVFFSSPFLEEHVFKQAHFSLAIRTLIVVLPLATLTEILLVSLQGLRHISQHVLVKNILQPLIRLILLALLFIAGLKLKGLLWATASSVIFGFFITSYFLFRTYLTHHKQARTIVEKAKISHFSKPLFFNNMLSQVFSALPILFLGYFHSAIEVGIFGVALRLGLIVSLPLAAFNIVFVPTISNLYGRGEKESLAKLFKISTRWIFTISLAGALVLMLFAKPILSIFGSQFVAGALALYFLVLGELINAGVGSVGFMLMMTGRPKINLINSIILFFLTLGLGFIFIARYGVLGAALTTALSVALINILRLLEVYHFERIHPFNRNFSKPIIAGILALLIVLALKFFIPSENLLYDLVYVLVFGLIFVITLVKLRLEEEDLFVLGLVSRKLRFA